MLERFFRTWWSIIAVFWFITFVIVCVAVATNPFTVEAFIVLLVSFPLLFIAGFFPYWIVPFAEPMTWYGLLMFLGYSVAVMSYVSRCERLPRWMLYPWYILLVVLYAVSHYFFYVS